ncbi:C40 family peptidase [Microlunatus panaciterrae]|uniref:Cell wall-associated NlpC family hydrolase n=1 Tax=Microlunatus panaciterrae TaxID=400768 RepID=A0ABS2RNL7_9ACTN|nr:cell wall-associated NlpC family hydrolase [Microlunatus panaciterrae]
MTSRTRTFLRNAALGVSAVALTATIFSGVPAAADPPLTIDEAKTQVTQLETEAAAIDQEYAGIQQKVAAGKKALKTKQADVAAQTAKVARMRNQVGQVALAQFQNRTIDTTAQLFFTSDTAGFLSQISTVEKVSENQNTVLQDFQREQANLAGLQRSAETDLSDLKKHEQKLKDLRAASDQKVLQAKAVLSKLTDQERRRLAAEEAARAAADRKAAESAQSAGSRSGTATSRSSDRTSKDAPSTSTGSGKGATALAFARRQLGKPYRYGSAGPDAYDCSGLTGAAWAAAGVSLARTSQAQFGNGRPVSRSELQPGDLVFFYSGLSHVALYAGNGQVIHASRPGKPIGYASVDSMPFAGARRPG